MTSTHDMSPLRSWWRENPGKTQRYFSEVLGREGIAPVNCTPDICSQIISNHLNSNSMLTILPWQDWTSIDEKVWRANVDDERINIPSNPRHYWGYRMHLTIEDLLLEEEWNSTIREMIKNAGRS